MGPIQIGDRSWQRLTRGRAFAAPASLFLTVEYAKAKHWLFFRRTASMLAVPLADSWLFLGCSAITASMAVTIWRHARNQEAKSNITASKKRIAGNSQEQPAIHRPKSVSRSDLDPISAAQHSAIFFHAEARRDMLGAPLRITRTRRRKSRHRLNLFASLRESIPCWSEYRSALRRAAPIRPLRSAPRSTPAYRHSAPAPRPAAHPRSRGRRARY